MHTGWGGPKNRGEAKVVGECYPGASGQASASVGGEPCNRLCLQAAAAIPTVTTQRFNRAKTSREVSRGAVPGAKAAAPSTHGSVPFHYIQSNLNACANHSASAAPATAARAGQRQRCSEQTIAA